MREPSPSGPRPLDLLIAALAVLWNIAVVAGLEAWDFIRRSISRLSR